MTGRMIYLSIVVPIRNEEKFILENLRQLVRQEYSKDRYEILVVDGMSTDSTAKEVQEFIAVHPDINIKFLENPGILSSRARNVGVRNAHGKIIAFIDGHVYIPDDQLFVNIEKSVTANNAIALARPQHLDVPVLDKNSKAYWIAVSRKTWLGHSTKSFIYGEHEGFVDPTSSGFAYHRSVFDKVGYFDESFDAAEDVEFNYRVKQAGIMAYTSHKLLVYYYPREHFLALFKQQTRYGEGRARFVKKHPQSFSIETLVPVAVFVFFMFFPLAVIIQRPAWVFLIVVCLAFLYWGILLATAIKETLQWKRFWPVLLVSFGIWVTHMGLGWGFLKTIILVRNIFLRKTFM
ncbi:MAG: glycosyltransferase [Desulfobacteraceae bacterium]|nr:glycosyltransferase [Desulfobacteraceae bacterium]